MSETADTKEMAQLLAISKEAAERQTQLFQMVTEETKGTLALMKEEIEYMQQDRELLEDLILSLDKNSNQLIQATAALVKLWQEMNGKHQQMHQ